MELNQKRIFRKCNSPYLLPELQEEFLDITLIDSHENDCRSEKCQVFPFADSEVFKTSIVLNPKKLTFGEDVKEVFSIELPSYGRTYEPGDTIGIVPHNSDEQLTQLFKHLKILHLVHRNCKISLKNTVQKLKSVPFYIEQITTLYKIFKYHVDINCLPKKTLIRVLVEYTKDENERLILEELCSKEGFKKYEDNILERNETFLELLKKCSSCCPPVARLLENLPILLPRVYSISSSPLSSPDSLKIVFTVAKTVSSGTMKEGLCSGMLKSVVEEKESLGKEFYFKMFYRKPSVFRLPDNDKIPCIFIAAGSGIAPFIGFLDHRKMQQLNGINWLFYGCRYKSKDYLFKDQLQEYLKIGVLSKLFVSFSREVECEEKYVQDNVKKFGKDICDMIFDKNAIIYVCGDAKGLRKDVLNTFIEIIQKYRELNSKEASNYIKTLQKQNRYIQDIWL